MRKPEKVRFELRTNQNLSRQNLQRAYESLSVEEPEIVNDIPVIGAFIRGLKHIVRKCIRWYVMPVWGKQKDYNQIVANMAEDYDRMHTLLMEENDILRSHVEQLQIQVTQLNARLQMRSIFELNANRAPRIIQLVSSLNFGDAVGNDALAIKHMLEGAGYATAIFTFAVHPKIKEENVYNIDLLPELTEDDIIIYHYASEDGFQKLIEETAAKVVLRYHNVTPPEFFHGYDEKAETITRKGMAQIKSMKDAIDYGMVDSEQNKKDLEQMGYECPISVVSILIPFKDYEQQPDLDVVNGYSDGNTNIVFVGRIVPNKKFEDVIACFAAYKKKYDPAARLFLVGNYQETDRYYQYLQEYIKKCGVEDVIFPGHIAFDAILAYYKIADVFLCMSEHEGFCVPLVEAMFFETPIVAYASTAIPGTLGGSGVLVESKEPERVAEKIHQVIEDEQYKNAIVKEQKKRLQDFSYENIKEQILDELKKVQRSKIDKVRKQNGEEKAD